MNPEILFARIRFGSRVTIRTPHGSFRTGRAVLRGPAGWVLNLGGPHGTPGIATPVNLVAVGRSHVTPSRSESIPMRQNAHSPSALDRT